ncbi:MAG: hypothetical protein Q7R92_02770 [bacterium]|nr:hypothetical protein [bacterium]
MPENLLFYTFIVADYKGNPYELKSFVRRTASHKVTGNSLPGTNLGPIRFQRYAKTMERELTRREAVFGVGSPADNSGGGFKGLVMWRGMRDGLGNCQVVAEMARSRLVGAADWIIDFVRQCILLAGLKIAEERGLTRQDLMKI